MTMFLAYVCFAIAIVAIVVILRTAILPVRQVPKRRETHDGRRTPQLLAAIARLDEIEGKPKNKSVLGSSGRRPNRKASGKKDSPKYKQLLGMLNGDRETADNLVHAYGVDKAIDDLIRDRR